MRPKAQQKISAITKYLLDHYLHAALRTIDISKWTILKSTSVFPFNYANFFFSLALISIMPTQDQSDSDYSDAHDAIKCVNKEGKSVLLPFLTFGDVRSLAFISKAILETVQRLTLEWPSDVREFARKRCSEDTAAMPLFYKQEGLTLMEFRPDGLSYHADTGVWGWKIWKNTTRIPNYMALFCINACFANREETQMFFCGGTNSPYCLRDACLTAGVFDIETGDWADLPPMNGHCIEALTFRIHSKIHLVGGMYGESENETEHMKILNTITSTRLFCFDLELGQWVDSPFAAPPIPMSKNVAQVRVLNDNEVVFACFYGENIHVLSLDVNSGQWSELPTILNRPEDVCFHSLEVFRYEGNLVIVTPVWKVRLVHDGTWEDIKNLQEMGMRDLDIRFRWWHPLRVPDEYWHWIEVPNGQVCIPRKCKRTDYIPTRNNL